MKALIIEDSSAFARALNDLLNDQGWNVTITSSWNEAKSALNADSYDVLFIDILLPKTSGMEILNTIKDQPVIHNSRIILMSGFFSQKALEEKVPAQLKSRTICMIKPLNEQLLTETLNAFMQSKTFTATNIAIVKTKPSSFNIPKDRTFYGYEWIEILFKAYKSRFEGVLTVHTDTKEIVVIEFKNGTTIKVSSTHKESYFGALLVKHGLILKKDLLNILNDKDTDTPMGQKLIQSGLLSPHLVNLMLKEQIKIRMSQFLSSLSFTLDACPKPIESSEELVAFSESDLMEWAIDCIKTKFTDHWLKSFFDKNKNNYIHPVKGIKSSFNHPFIKGYRTLFDKIHQSATLNDIVGKLSLTSTENLSKKMKTEHYRKILGMIYFGIVTQSLKIRSIEKIKKKSKKLEQLADTILQSDPNNLFMMLGLPEKASVAEVEASYKKIAKFMHPDRYPPSISEELKQKCQKAFIKVSESHETLTNEEKRDLYLKKMSDDLFINIISLYEEGLSALYSGNYKLAVRLFSRINDKPKAPSNTLLYMIWAQIKANPTAMKRQSFAGDIKTQINSIPMEERVSYMFWFINGLYCSYTGNYERSISLFKKALQLKKDFKEAKTECRQASFYLDQTKPVQSTKGIFSKFFKTG